ncbi:MAG: muconolactone Delta-isomerase family protein [Dehalococcoidia bacterium]
MLYFVRAELRQMPPMPREQWMGQVVATWQVLAELERTGRAKGVGALIGKAAGVAIIDLESHDELAVLLQRLPVSAYLEWQIEPLISAQQALENARWSTAAAARG